VGASCDVHLKNSEYTRPVDINPSNKWKNVSYEKCIQKCYILCWTKAAGDAMQDEQNCWSMWAMCELRQAKFTEKLEEVHAAYQKISKRCQLMEEEKLIKG
jgi:E3 ubiquitin-protein ligase CCNP1IP1